MCRSVQRAPDGRGEQATNGCSISFNVLINQNVVSIRISQSDVTGAFARFIRLSGQRQPCFSQLPLDLSNIVKLARAFSVAIPSGIERQDVRSIQSELEDRGIAFDQKADPDGNGPASFIITDPDGNTIRVDQHV